MTDPTPADWAYLAGCLDCDGTIQLIRKTDGCGHFVNVAVCNKSKNMLINLESLFGGKYREKVQSISRLEWYKQEHVKRILEGVRPYLRGKVEEADIVLEYINASNGVGKWTSLSKERLEYIYQRGKELKHGARA